MLGLVPAVCAAQAREPVPIHEETAGLLAQAKIPPRVARLTALAEVPGARIVAATLERQGDRLTYSLGLHVDGHAGIEHVRIDATSGQVLCTEYHLEWDQEHDNVWIANPDVLAGARFRLLAAIDTALAQAPDGNVVGITLKVQQSGQIYMFDFEVGEGAAVKRVSINANNGAVISVEELK
jgi:uncharacterized membrane protein YkoI